MHKSSELFPPLDDLETLIKWLSEITGRDQADVQRRLLAECDFCGKCICEDAAAFGLVPNVWNEQMIEFYRVTDAFLFSNASWNSTRMKRKLTNTVCRVLTERLPPRSKILCYGDGMGFDSAALAKCGFRVTYYEVSDLALEFARRLFSLNELEVGIERKEDRIATGTFDAIVCLDVLEHLPDPGAAVQKFSNWLGNSGFLVVHAPFYAVEATQPTHLLSNRPLSGVIQGLYGKAGFEPLETGGLLLNPILLQKGSENVSKPQLLSRAQLRVAQAIVWFAKFLKITPKVAAAAGSIPPYQWRKTLVAASQAHQ